MGGAEAGIGASGLGPRRRIARVGVDDPADRPAARDTAAGASACRWTGGGRPRPRDPSSSADDDHVVRGESAYGTPLGLMTSTPASRSTPLTLPNESATSPDRPEGDVGRGDGRLEVGEGHRRQPRGGRPEPGRSARGIQTRMASTDAVGPREVRDRRERRAARRPRSSPRPSEPDPPGPSSGRAPARARRSRRGGRPRPPRRQGGPRSRWQYTRGPRSSATQPRIASTAGAGSVIRAASRARGPRRRRPATRGSSSDLAVRPRRRPRASRCPSRWSRRSPSRGRAGAASIGSAGASRTVPPDPARSTGSRSRPAAGPGRRPTVAASRRPRTGGSAAPGSSVVARYLRPELEGPHEVRRAAGAGVPRLRSPVPGSAGDPVRAPLERVDVEEAGPVARDTRQHAVEHRPLDRVGAGRVAGGEQEPPGEHHARRSPRRSRCRPGRAAARTGRRTPRPRGGCPSPPVR